MLSKSGVLILTCRCVTRYPTSILPSILQIFAAATLRISRKRRCSVSFRHHRSIARTRCVRVVHLGADILLTTTVRVNTVLTRTAARRRRVLCGINRTLNVTFRLRSSCLSICNSRTRFNGPVKRSVYGGGRACLLVGTLLETGNDSCSALLR